MDELLASGRDADVYACGPGLVLRRTREGRSLVVEARVMEHARAAGFPVPAVERVSDDGTEMVMQRIDGRLLIDEFPRRPWALDRFAAVLADLHHRLHQVPAPEWLVPAPGAPGDRLLHLDLHPLNVMMGPTGPVVIDWTNAARGDPATDVALTWLLLASGDVPSGRVVGAVLGRFRARFVARFLRRVDVTAARAALPAVVSWKMGDPHMSDREKASMRALAALNGP